MINKFFILLIILKTCESTYLKYYMSDFCLSDENRLDSHIEILNNSAINTSILVESSRMGQRISNNTCVLRISISKRVDGLIINALNISINNNSTKNCADYIEFGSSPIAKWCNTSDAQSLIFSDSDIDIIFRAEMNSSSYFKIAITPYENPISGQFCTSSAPLKCENSGEFECISNIFKCDGIKNCPNGIDEINCSKKSDLIKAKDISNNITVTAYNNIATNKILSHLKYSEYDIMNYCNPSVTQVINLKSINSKTPSPAILKLSPYMISNQICSLRFLPQTPISKYGLIVGIDEISIKNNDNIEISGSDMKTKIIWDKTKTDIGMPFAGTAYVDIVFHAGYKSNSSFKLLITPFEEPTNILGRKFCLKLNSFQCKYDPECKMGCNQCILKQFKCDGHRNCPTGLDEPNDCPLQPTTSTTTTLLTTSDTTMNTTTTIETTTITNDGSVRSSCSLGFWCSALVLVLALRVFTEH